MPYNYIATSANPRLLILLTDELEESVKPINRIIDRVIQINFDGDAPKNRCFISVIGYNREVKDLCSGWLKDLDASPLRYEALKKKTPDGAGGIVEIEIKQPVWVEPMNREPSKHHYLGAIQLSIRLTKAWLKDYGLLSPIVIDISRICYAEYAGKEIVHLKAIAAQDGFVLFWGCYQNETSALLFSDIPEVWLSVIRKSYLESGWCESGVLSKETICSILSIVMDCGSLELGKQDCVYEDKRICYT